METSADNRLQLLAEYHSQLSNWEFGVNEVRRRLGEVIPEVLEHPVYGPRLRDMGPHQAVTYIENLVGSDISSAGFTWDGYFVVKESLRSSENDLKRRQRQTARKKQMNSDELQDALWTDAFEVFKQPIGYNYLLITFAGAPPEPVFRAWANLPEDIPAHI